LTLFRQRWRPPFLFTGSDVERLVAAASSVVRWRLPAATHSTLIDLLAVTGMRVGEALKLDDVDLDRDQGIVHVRQSKFGKSRLVPLDPSTVDALRSYEPTRDLLVERQEPALLVSLRGNRMIYETAQATFRRLCDTPGSEPTRRTGPGSTAREPKQLLGVLISEIVITVDTDAGTAP
jgi:integrase/recombinase XerD